MSLRRPSTVHDLPLVLTIPEAAEVLRLSRSTAYELARRYEATSGREGLPVVRLGRRLRVPRHRLEQLLESADGTRGESSRPRPP